MTTEPHCSTPPDASVPEQSLDDHPLVPEILESERAFAGAVWDIRRERFALRAPDGGRQEITREFVDHTGAVAVLAMDEAGRVLLIRQYRHPMRTEDLELPAGLLDVAAEHPLDAAQRELAEEADLTATTWHLLCEFFTSPGGSNEALRVYLARDLSAAPQPYRRTDEEAGIEKLWVELDDAVEAVLARRAQNAVLAIAVLAARLERDRDWRGLAPARSPWPRHPRNRAGFAAD